MNKEGILDYIETVNAFKKELYELYDKYDIAISHEDGQGAFMLRDADEHHRQWMEHAFIDEIEGLNKQLAKIELKELW